MTAYPTEKNFGKGYWIDRFQPVPSVTYQTGGNYIVTKSIPTGSIDGSNKQFIVQIFVNMQLYLNGLLQSEPDDYSVTNQVTPLGVMNGSNKIFILPVIPTVSDLPVYWNGLSLTLNDDYTLSGNTLMTVLAPSSGDQLTVILDVGIITFINPPLLGDKLLTITGISKKYIPSGSINGSNVNFSLPIIPDKLLFQLFENGMLQRENIDYVLSGLNIQMTVAPRSGDKLIVYF